jgi:hypothetical protein
VLHNLQFKEVYRKRFISSSPKRACFLKIS